MPEYIERESQLRKDCPMRHENGNCLPSGGFCTAVNAPICAAMHNAYYMGKTYAADVVEVVRCKDCKHFCPYEGEEHKGDCAELVGLESCVYEDDFCSYAERRCDTQ